MGTQAEVREKSVLKGSLPMDQRRRKARTDSSPSDS